MVDAPLSGTHAAAARGELSIVVGAAPGLYRDALPVLELLGSCVRVGGVGSAQIANACEQYVIAATAMAVSEAAVIAERAGLDLSRVLDSWQLSGRKPGAWRCASQAPQPRLQPDLPAGAALAPLEVAAQQAWRTGTTARLLGNVRELFQLLDRGWAEQSGSDVHLPVPGRTAPRASGSTGLAVGTPGVRASVKAARADSHLHASPARVLQSGQLKNHYHQNDDDEDTDNGSDKSSVHGHDLLSSLSRYPHATGVNTAAADVGPWLLWERHFLLAEVPRRSRRPAEQRPYQHAGHRTR